MTPQRVVIAFASGALALVIGWLGGAKARDIWGDQYEVGIGAVDTVAGVPVATASPPPTQAATQKPTPTSTPVDTPGSILCEGAPPDPACDCDLQGGEWVWQCPLGSSPSLSPAEPSPSTSPTVPPILSP